jgi:GT2 family glycosyltransferase
LTQVVISPRNIAVATICFNSSSETLQCVRSLMDAGFLQIIVLDNASDPAHWGALTSALGATEAVRLVRSETNLGFAEGCNLLFRMLFDAGELTHVLLFNNDAVALPNLRSVVETLSEETDLAGASLTKVGSNEIDSCGIVMFRNGVASNRLSEQETYFGPTGACLLISRRLTNLLQETHGYTFDPDYFCYAEDTDLVARARLLGVEPVHCPHVVGTHRGQASSSFMDDGFIAFHGLRNSIATVLKCFPRWMLVTTLPLLAGTILGAVARDLRCGNGLTSLRAAIAAIGDLPRTLQKRARIQATATVSAERFRDSISRTFYRRRYLVDQIKRLVAGDTTRHSRNSR